MTLRVVTLAVVAYAIHFAWEMGHAKWFETMKELPFWTATAWCARAALWDVAISVLAYLIASLTGRNVHWIRRPSPFQLTVYIALGLAVTVAVERWALAGGRWRYAATMPTIAGIGLSPLLQWIAVPLLIAAAARLIISPSRSHR